MRQPTIEVAKYWAKTGAEVLFAEKDPFDGLVDQEILENELYNQILRNIVDHNTSDISEGQLQKCIEDAREKTTDSREKENSSVQPFLEHEPQSVS